MGVAVADKVEELIKAKDLKIIGLENRVRHLEEQLRLALYRAFGKSSEKLPGQDDLPFEDLKVDETPATIEAVVVAEHERRSKAGRKPLADSLPRVDVPHDLTGAELTCACGHQLTKIGEDISEKLVMIPAQVWVDRHHHSKYACKHCEGLSDETKPAVIRAAGELDLIARSIVSPALLAHIWTAKFCDHLPFYRQEAGFARIGAEISRQNMVNWTMTVSGELEPVTERIEAVIREGPLINMDETPVKVLKMPHTGKEGQGYMWLVRGGTKTRKAVRYRFAPGRGSQHAKAILRNFRGYVQSDAFGAYDVVAQDGQIIQVGCWAHARRKFMDAEKAAPSNLTKDAIGRIRKLYELEKTCREHAKKQGLTDEEFLEHRRSVIAPFLVDLRTWLDANAAQTLPSGATGKAFAYTAGQWDKLVRFLDHPWLTPDNNVAENAIRPFVLGRKNWLFHGNEEGAEASCRIYTLIETAKLNDLEPWAYLKEVLEKLPTVRLTGDWDSLLPWNINQGKN